MKKVIVTGATGFLGKAVTEELVQAGVTVYAIVRDIKKASCFQNNPLIQVIVCDMDEIDQLEKRITSRNFDAFYHFAWKGTTGKSREDYTLQLSNVGDTCKAVEVAHQLGCDKFIFAGSLMEYESMKYIPQNQSKPVLNYIYRTAKLTAHFMAKAVAVSLNQNFISTIISNVYGCGEISPRLINSSLKKMIHNEKTDFTPAEQLYDFIYIEDAARAFSAIGENGIPYSEYYIGNREIKPLKEYLMEMRDCVDKKLELGIGKIPFDGISLSYEEFNRDQLYNDTGFKADISFSEGICKTIAWLRETDK